MLGAFVNKSLALEQHEAKALGVAAAEVAKHYPAMSSVVDPKVMAWWGLLQTAGMVYGPRALMIYRGSRAPGPATVAAPPPPGAPGTNGTAVWPQ